MPKLKPFEWITIILASLVMVVALVVFMYPILTHRSYAVTHPPTSANDTQYYIKPGAGGSEAMVPKYNVWSTVFAGMGCFGAMFLDLMLIMQVIFKAKRRTFSHLEKD